MNDDWYTWQWRLHQRILDWRFRLRHPFYVGDGISGCRQWVYARVLWRLHRYIPAAPLPDGWYWCYRATQRGFYARHDS